MLKFIEKGYFNEEKGLKYLSKKFCDRQLTFYICSPIQKVLFIVPHTKLSFCICRLGRHLIKSNDSVAQPVEHYTFNVRVLGSNPSGITRIGKKPRKRGAFLFKNCVVRKGIRQ